MPTPASAQAPVCELRAACLQGPCTAMHAHTCAVGALCGAGGPAPSVREQVWGWEDPVSPGMPLCGRTCGPCSAQVCSQEPGANLRGTCLWQGVGALVLV